MPHRRKRPDGKRPQRGVACYRELVRLVEEKVRDHKVALRWIREWLTSNPSNRRTLIPSYVQMTLIAGLRILFYYPWKAIANVVGREAKIDLDVLVAIGDSDPTTVLVLEEKTRRWLYWWERKAEELRFPTVKVLSDWMGETADVIVKIARNMQ